MRTFGIVFLGASAVTPVEKVVNLLKKMQSEVEAEAKAEAEAYDKYACFCKEQADEFLHATTKSQKIIDELTAQIENLSAKINTLNGQIGDANKQISSTEAEMTTEATNRENEKAEYVTSDEDVREAIDELNYAIKFLKDEAKHVKAHQDQALVQAVSTAVIHSPNMVFSDREQKLVRSFLDKNPGEAHASEFHSQDILALLMKMLQVFKQKKAQDDAEETASRQSFEMAQQKRGNLVKKLEKNVREMMATVAKLSEEKTGQQGDKTAETTKLADDSGFLTDLTTKCENKATSWDARSSSRTNELSAISSALEALTGGAVAEKYKANKKLNMIQGDDDSSADSGSSDDNFVPAKGDSIEQGLEVADEDDLGAGFVQLSQTDTKKKIINLLRTAAAKQHSAILAVTAVKVSRDPFKKVRDLINDLIDKLEKQGDEEADEKDFCDTEMSAALTDKDTAMAGVESSKAGIAQHEARIAELKQEIKDLEQENADLDKQNQEAEELNSKESADDEKTLEEAEAGKVAVQNAINALNDYYNAFLQQPADSSGKTVDDKAPEELSSEAKSGQANQVLDFLAVIKSDFERTITSVTASREQAQTDFEAGNSERAEQKTSNEADITSKGAELAKEEQDLFDENDAMTGHQETLKLAEEALETLKPQCVSGPVDFRERTERRNQEIDSLKSALAILEESTANVQTTSLKAVDFMQKKRA
jgi:chromosome segregation ATPase